MISFAIDSLENESDRDFIIWLYQEFKYIMLSTAKKYVSNPEDQEDIVQESIVKLIKKVDLLRGKERCVLAVYVVYTVRNAAKNHLRHAAVEKTHFDELDESIEHAADLIPLDDLMVLKERTVRLNDLLKRLSDDERTLLIGKYVLGDSDEDLGKQLNCKPASVRMKLTRARRKALAMMVEDEVLGYDKT